MKTNLAARVSFIGALAVIVSCNLAPIEVASGGGGGIETVGVTGVAVYTNTGLPAAQAYVRIRKTRFLADVPEMGLAKTGTASRDIVTDAAGRFAADSIDTGSYTIEINDGRRAAALIACTISGASAKVNLGTAALKPFGAITGSAGVSIVNKPRFARVYGLERCAVVDPSGGFSLTDIPEGAFSLQIAGADALPLEKNIDSVVVVAGASTAAPPVGWQYSRKLYLNTSSSGAGIKGTVLSFPVLVRLTDSTFSFNEAKSGGNDLRFAKSDGTMLPFSVERWDRAAGVAEIWVKVDTVYGDDSTRSLVMLWGNAAAVSASSNAGVFGRDNGFAAVWHLDADCRDASGNGHDGTNFGATDVAGIVGTSKKFNGSDSIVINGLLGSPKELTLSAWVAVDTTVPSGQEVVSIGDAVLLRSEETVNKAGAGAYFYTSADTFVPVSSGRFFAKTGWHHVAFTFNNTTHEQSLYIDGSLATTFDDVDSINYAKAGVNTLIGAHGIGKKTFNSRGTVDEVRVCAVARSADWIKLCYMNQRPDDRLTAFK
jgi:hypothetical protein